MTRRDWWLRLVFPTVALRLQAATSPVSPP